ncbi:MAG: hypothetical protein ACRD96_04180, partial [Bryobacteraceae bacterium]
MIRLFRVFIPTGVVALVLSEALLITACYLAAAYVVMEKQFSYPFSLYLTEDDGWLRIALVVLSIMLGLHLTDLYTRIKV